MYTYGRKQGCRMSLDYTYRDMRVAFLENELIHVGILLDKGADVFTFQYKPMDLDFLWQSPIELRKPFVSTSALPEGAFHDYYYGGWQEVLPSAGWASEPYKGTYQGLHGEVSLLPFEAQVVEDNEACVRLKVKTRTYRSPLNLERELRIEKGKPALFIKERLENESPEQFAIMWGHHPAFGPPFLSDSCVVTAPAKQVEVLDFHPHGLWEPGGDYDFPMVKNKRTGELEDITQVRSQDTSSVDVVFYKNLDAGWYGLTNQEKEVGFGMAWDKELFKYLWMWQVYGGHDDYPWYGRTYNCALEPFTSYPPAGIKNAIENGTAYFMEGLEVIETEFVALVYEGKEVKEITRDGFVST